MRGALDVTDMGPSFSRLIPFLLILFACSGGDGEEITPSAASSGIEEGGGGGGGTSAAGDEEEDADAPPPSANTPTPGPTAAPLVRRFTNAVVKRDCPDPGVVRVLENDKPVFYMVCTGGRFQIRRSTDLIDWTETGKFLLPDGKASWSANGGRNWAPEIHQLGPNSFIAYFTAVDGDDRLAIGVAHATNILGPWTTTAAPLLRHPIGVIDATYFKESDARGGKHYLYWKVDGNQRGEPTPILVRELAPNGRSFAQGSTAREVLTNAPNTWEGGVVEAPWIVERDGTYFMFYSGNVYDERYRTGVARSNSPLGPFVKKQGPILGNNNKWLGPGHGSIVRGTRSGSDDLFFVHHAWVANQAGTEADRDKGRWVLVEKVLWDGAGANAWPRFQGNTSFIGKQRAP